MALRHHTRPQSAARVSTITPALSGDATPHYMAPQMSTNDDGTPNPLPEELDRALRRATDRTVSALTALRKAVLAHVNSERDRGTSLDQIKLDLQEIISRVHDGAVKDGDGNGEHDIISAEVIKWSDGFYKRSD